MGIPLVSSNVPYNTTHAKIKAINQAIRFTTYVNDIYMRNLYVYCFLEKTFCVDKFVCFTREKRLRGKKIIKTKLLSLSDFDKKYS